MTYLRLVLMAMIMTCLIACGTTGPDSGDPIPSKVVATIQIGDSSNPVAICALNSGEYVYVSDSWGDVYVIRTNSNTVVDMIPIGNWCSLGICADIADAHVYVSCTPTSGGGGVAVINTADNTVESMISLGMESMAEGLCILPGQNFLYVASSYGDRVFVVDTETLQAVDSIAVGGDPTGICASPSGDYVYVTNKMDNTVSVIRTSDNTVIAVRDVGYDPTAVCCTPDGAYAYIANGAGTGSVSVLRTSDNQVIKTINAASYSESIAPLMPSSDYIYVADTNAESVSIISVADQDVVMTVGVGWRPDALCSVPSRNFVYVANNVSGDVTVLGI
jgi:YVTN family beta-propeller protein